MSRTYNFGNGIRFGGDGFVEVRRRWRGTRAFRRALICCAAPQVLAATQTPGTGGTEWFQGTADAVRQYSWLFADVKNKDVEDVVILSGAPACARRRLRGGTDRAACCGWLAQATTCTAWTTWTLCRSTATPTCARQVLSRAAAAPRRLTPMLAALFGQADITVSALPMDNSRASDFGLMKVCARVHPAALGARGSADGAPSARATTRPD
jgi:hypothetical protein